MAGAGYKLFNTGDVLTAQQVNEYLMQQTVMSFANAAARTTALSGVLAEGMVSYLQDTNVVEIYTGASWVSLDDPNAIQNSLLTTTGDTIYASGVSTPARLGIGTTGQVLTVAGGVPTWATPSSGGMTSIATGSLSTAQTNITGISGSYIHLYLVVANPQATSSGSLQFRLQNDAGATVYAWVGLQSGSASASASGNVSYLTADFGNASIPTSANNMTFTLQVNNYTSTRPKDCHLRWVNGNSPVNSFTFGAYNNTAAITQINVLTTAGTFNGGTYTLYGVK